MKKGVKKQAVSKKLHVRKTSKKPIGESGNLGIKKQYVQVHTHGLHLWSMKRNDKSRYNGCPMNIYGAILPGATSLTRLSVKVSKQARQRIKWFDYYHKCQNISLTCRYYGISRKTFYKWKRRYLKYHLPSLENNSRRPKHSRQSWDRLRINLRFHGNRC